LPSWTKLSKRDVLDYTLDSQGVLAHGLYLRILALSDNDYRWYGEPEMIQQMAFPSQQGRPPIDEIRFALSRLWQKKYLNFYRAKEPDDQDHYYLKLAKREKKVAKAQPDFPDPEAGFATKRWTPSWMQQPATSQPAPINSPPATPKKQALHSCLLDDGAFLQLLAEECDRFSTDDAPTILRPFCRYRQSEGRCDEAAVDECKSAVRYAARKTSKQEGVKSFPVYMQKVLLQDEQERREQQPKRPRKREKQAPVTVRDVLKGMANEKEG